ncbi:hypothetical protein Cgig2_015293 [Carnegiea gigantea]|uniref:Uncharacterized protein n=1 Tax=Carnegiea gigantea TaxID=171969 RepID=A0A9Q1GJN5_9CARY|nr:hypothetical protein Cgig2_015293 [Carnegiea gigantea]
MKLVDDRWVIKGNRQQLGERHLLFSVGRFLPESRGCDPQMTGFSIAEGQTIRLPRPPPKKGQILQSRLDDPQSIAASLPLLFSPALSASCHLFWSCALGLEGHEPCPHLICIKQNESQHRFFTMAITKPGLLLKQYHPKSPVSLGALWAAEGTASRGPTSLTVGAPENSGPSATISTTNPSDARPFLLSTDLPGANHPLRDEELVDAPSEDELLDELSEEELDDNPPEVELELVEATSAPRRPDAWSRLGLHYSSNLKISYVICYRDLSGIRHLHLYAEDTRGRGILTAGPRGRARFKKGHYIGNLFGFPTLILSRDASYHSTIDKGREARELWVSALYLGACQPFRNIPTG